MNSPGIRIEFQAGKSFILEAFRSALGPSQPPIRWITELFFRMERDGQFLSCSIMPSLVGLVGVEVKSQGVVEQDSMRSHKSTKPIHPMRFNFFAL